MKVEEIIVVIRFLAKFAFVGSSMHQISVKWMSDKHQMPSDNTNSTYLIMESIHYWSHFIGFILWGVNFLESLYSRVRILGFFKQFKPTKVACSTYFSKFKPRAASCNKSTRKFFEAFRWNKKLSSNLFLLKSEYYLGFAVVVIFQLGNAGWSWSNGIYTEIV